MAARAFPGGFRGRTCASIDFIADRRSFPGAQPRPRRARAASADPRRRQRPHQRAGPGRRAARAHRASRPAAWRGSALPPPPRSTPTELAARIDKYLQPMHVERATRMAATLAQVRLRDLGVDPEENAALQDLNTALMYSCTAPGGRARPGGPAPALALRDFRRQAHRAGAHPLQQRHGPGAFPAAGPALVELLRPGRRRGDPQQRGQLLPDAAAARHPGPARPHAAAGREQLSAQATRRLFPVARAGDRARRESRADGPGAPGARGRRPAAGAAGRRRLQAIGGPQRSGTARQGAAAHAPRRRYRASAARPL